MSEFGSLLQLRSVRKAYGPVEILRDIDLDVRDGEFITILGPSGSGKTTVLRLIGGFTRLTGGQILLDGRNIDSTPINRRPFNTVFQDYALFPHLTVEQNVGYGLVVQGVKRAEVASRVKEALDLVRLGALATRFPSQLSGGQRQRVALARAIVCRPRLVLLDEPLSALDIELRREMQSFLKSIQSTIKTTFLFVTHDQEEAVSMADRICVMNGGRIQQIGSPNEVYYRPRSEFVARFFGENNLIKGISTSLSAGARAVDTPVGRIVCAADDGSFDDIPDGSEAWVVCRPEAVRVEKRSSDGDTPLPDANHIRATAYQAAFTGPLTTVTALSEQDGKTSIRVRLPSRQEQDVATEIGRRIVVSLPPESCRMISA